jgi:hypothetical protein
MKNRGKWLVVTLAVCSLAPSSFAATGTAVRRNFNVQVPEGGSALIYLLGAGLTCMGAMFLRSRLAAKSSQS